MDHIKNPFSPGAGSPPPELVGRDAILQKVRILLGRVRQRRSEKSMIYSPAYGDMAFTVPLFDEFMLREMPEFKPKGEM